MHLAGAEEGAAARARRRAYLAATARREAVEVVAGGAPGGAVLVATARMSPRAERAALSARDKRVFRARAARTGLLSVV